jgi:hypothetical protein
MEIIKIISSMGIGALGMWFMYKLSERMLTDVVSSLNQINKTMETFVLEQHAEHKEIISTLKAMKEKN